ncbi:hypothetical protein, partial [Klebsiella pneumoniae]
GDMNVERQAFVILDNDDFYGSGKNTIIEHMNLAGNLFIQDMSTENVNEFSNFQWENREITVDPASYFQVVNIDDLYLDHGSVSLKPKIDGTNAIFNELVVK